MEKVANQHPLKGLYLIRYGKDVPGAEHTISILDPPEGMRPEDATELNANYVQHVMHKLQKYSPLDRDLSKIDEKYANDYIVMRRQTEAPLIHAAASKGITPENSHPLYFILHHEKNPDPPLMPGKIMVAIPAENIPAHLVSFTADDSFYSFPELNPLLPDQDHGKVFNSQEMGRLIKNRGWLPSTKEKPRYFEAQLWSRRIEDFDPVITPAPSTVDENTNVFQQQEQQPQQIAQRPRTRTRSGGTSQHQRAKL